MGYVLVTVRMPEAVALQIRNFAKDAGWQLADFQRTLLCIGAAFFFLSYGNEAGQEAASTLMSGMKLLKFTRSLGLNPRLRHGRYAFRNRFGKSTLTTLSLPESFIEGLAAYADLRRVSRNQVYSKSLQQGLLVYLKAQAYVLDPKRNQKNNNSTVKPPSVPAVGRSVVE